MQDASSSDWGFVNMKDVKNQLDAQKDAKEIIVHIHSEGGDVTEGFAIHDLLKAQGKPVTTQCEGLCASIATVIFLAGDTRIMSSNSEFFIHNPWGFAGGESGDIQQYADNLKKIEDKISDLYVTHSNMTKEEALQYMKDSKSFTAAEAYDAGFANTPSNEIKAVAKFRKNNTQMSKEAVTKEEVQGMFAKLMTSIKEAIAPKAVALVVQDANSTDVTFPDLEDDATPSVGDKATVDGSPASGEYVMPSGETYVFESGELTEIKTDGSEDEEMLALKEENENLKTQIEDLKASNLKLEQAKKDHENKLKEIQSEVVNLKKGLSSAFNYDPDLDPPKGDKEGSPKRKLFKKD